MRRARRPEDEATAIHADATSVSGFMASSGVSFDIGHRSTVFGLGHLRDPEGFEGDVRAFGVCSTSFAGLLKEKPIHGTTMGPALHTTMA